MYFHVGRGECLTRESRLQVRHCGFVRVAAQVLHVRDLRLQEQGCRRARLSVVSRDWDGERPCHCLGPERNEHAAEGADGHGPHQAAAVSDDAQTSRRCRILSRLVTPPGLCVGDRHDRFRPCPLRDTPLCHAAPTPLDTSLPLRHRPPGRRLPHGGALLPLSPSHFISMFSPQPPLRLSDCGCPFFLPGCVPHERCVPCEERRDHAQGDRARNRAVWPGACACHAAAAATPQSASEDPQRSPPDRIAMLPCPCAPRSASTPLTGADEQDGHRRLHESGDPRLPHQGQEGLLPVPAGAGGRDGAGLRAARADGQGAHRRPRERRGA